MRVPYTTVKQYVIWLCQACIDGVLSECHSPGCALWLHRVDLPIHRDLLTEVDPVWEESTGEERITGYKVKIAHGRLRKMSEHITLESLTEALAKKDAEIERLKNEYESLMGRFRVYVHESKQFITELADALEKRLPLARVGVEEIDAEFDLVQRAREASKI